MSGRWQLLERPENRPAATPEGGLRHAGTVTETRVFVPEYFCLDYRAAGLTPDPWFARNAAMVNTGAEQPAALDAEAREATRQRADDERVEAEKRERRNVLALNRLGDAAMMVRRRFVTRLLARKTPPKGAGLFVANCLGRDSYLLTNHNALTTTAELLGVDDAEAVAQARCRSASQRRWPRPGHHAGVGTRSSRGSNTKGRLAQRDTQLVTPRRQHRIPAVAGDRQQLPPSRRRGSHHRGQDF